MTVPVPVSVHVCIACTITMRMAVPASPIAAGTSAVCVRVMIVCVRMSMLEGEDTQEINAQPKNSHKQQPVCVYVGRVQESLKGEQ